LSLRTLCNVTYAFLTDGLDFKGRETFDRRLEEKFEYEMTPHERLVAQHRRYLEDKGTMDSDAAIRGMMGAPSV
jgi:hypothetical protein